VILGNVLNETKAAILLRLEFHLTGIKTANLISVYIYFNLVCLLHIAILDNSSAASQQIFFKISKGGSFFRHCQIIR